MIPLFILMRKRFPLIESINSKILRLQEGGYIEKLLKDTHRNRLKFDVPKKTEVVLQKKLNLEDMKMIGFLLVVGYIIAFIIFLGELITWRFKLRILQVEFIN